MTAESVAADPRIVRLRERFQSETPRISICRARDYTRAWRAASGKDPALRTAAAMRQALAGHCHHIDPDDRLAGSWTEFFLGLPLDVERGLFNQILATELDRARLVDRTLGAGRRAFSYALKHNSLGAILKNMKYIDNMPAPVDLKFRTMQQRDINPFRIADNDKKLLLDEILPFWKGRTVAEAVEREIARAGIYPESVREFVSCVVATPSRQVLLLSPAAALCTYQGHLIPDFGPVLERGLLGMKQDLDARRAGAEPEQQPYFHALALSLDGIITFCENLAAQLEHAADREPDPQTARHYRDMHAVCERAPLHPAASFREAIQAVWSIRCAMALAHPSNVHAPGRLDQILYPFYLKDLALDRIFPNQARTLIEELLLKIMSQNMRPESNMLGDFYLRYEGSEPVTLGGLTPDGGDACNDLTYLFLEAAERSRAVTNVVVRLHENTPARLYRAVADVLYRGASSVSVMNDDMHVPALERKGVAPEHARDYAITGCTDVIVPGRTGSASIAGLMLCRVLDAALRNGDCATVLGPVPHAGPRTGAPRTFDAFDDLVHAFMEQARYNIACIARASHIRDRVFAEKMPAPVISLFVNGCLESGRDITAGGAQYDFSGINMINSLANVVDSLYVFKRLVFDEKQFTMDQIIDAADRNFKGRESVRRAILDLDGKWGNGGTQSDAIARDISSRLFAETQGLESYKGAPWVCFVNSMTSHTIDGRLALATCDGRAAATPYASSCNPYNVEKGGITGVLRSVAAVDFSNVLGCSVNVRLHPSAIGESPEARDKWAALVRTFFKMGATQLQPTVASAQTLRAAQQDPASYRDLIIKVGGYSAYFTELGPEIQNEIITRTEHGG